MSVGCTWKSVEPLHFAHDDKTYPDRFDVVLKPSAQLGMSIYKPRIHPHVYIPSFFPARKPAWFQGIVSVWI